ncbi:MAG: glycine--tRNA ligase subunit beta [Alphaproteobacteria bacterium]
MADLLLELFSEEIPARMQAKAAADLQRLVMDGLKDAGLQGTAQAYATPRRLTLHVTGLDAETPDVSEERKGPKADAPEKAIEGFLRSTGLSRDDLEVRETKKGDVLFAKIEKPGRKTSDVVADVVTSTVRNFPWPKSMRWGSGTLKWVRPLHSILCVFDGAVVPFSVDHIEAGNTTRGHRFMGPDAFTVTDFADYEAKLKAAKVILNGKEREASILQQAEAAAKAAGLTLKEDPALIHEIAGLVEWPVVLTGAFEEEFLAVPAEVLVATMRKDQKYLALQDADGKLANKFLLTANLEAEDGGTHIIDGNQRVLRARLADARFFWEQDLKTPLADRVPQLQDIVFHAKLGTVADKMERVATLSREIASLIGADADKAEQAARLAKADLVSAMVYEFPEVQGIIGQRLAEAEGLDADIATAIGGHYAPQGPGDECPTNPVTIAVSLADKIDTLTGFFAIDEKPTGSKDPFALRRAALGVIRIVLENGLRLNLDSLFGDQADDLLAFIGDRLKVHLKDQGTRHDLVAAVFALGGQDDLVQLVARVDALAAFVDSDAGKDLLAGHKRATNILAKEEKKDGKSFDATPDVSLFADDDEKALGAALSAAQSAVAPALGAEDFEGAMKALSELRAPVDAFFETVTVNADDPALRENRLKLLAQIRDTLHQVADFSQIEG